jgi:ABC-2 type transport system permease protein
VARSSTRLLLRDELVGFAKSKVMIVLWIVLPAIAVLAYTLLPAELVEHRGLSRREIPASAFIGLILSSIAGTVAALMVAVDIVSERNRNVYVLFAIRPIRREAIVWAKFLGVFACVTIACVVSVSAGLAVDAIRGTPITGELLHSLGRTLVSLSCVIALSCGVGVVMGVLARTILVAVILILYVGQNLAIIPMIPTYFGLLPDKFWVFMVLSAVLAGVLVWGGGRLFRRAQL